MKISFKLKQKCNVSKKIGWKWLERFITYIDLSVNTYYMKKAQNYQINQGECVAWVPLADVANDAAAADDGSS